VLDFHEIRLNNFRSYRGEHTFVFPEEPGLYFITGQNKQDVRLESNGAGKSTLLDAIYWCLYGRSLRGLRGPDIITWGEKSAWVTLRMTVGDELFKIARAQAPNSLTLNGKVVEQDAINKAIRLNAEAFTYAVIMPQFGSSFFELTPALKLNIFSQILELEFWLKKSNEARSMSDSLQREIEKLTTQIDLKNQHLVEDGTEIVVLKEKDQKFAAEQKAKIKQLSIDIENYDAQLDEIAERIGVTSEAFESVTVKAHKLSKSVGEAKVRLSEAERELKRLKTLGATCPTCHQQIDQKGVYERKMGLEEAISELKGAANDAAIDKLNEEKTSLSNRLATLKTNYKLGQRDRYNAYEKLEETRKRANPYAELIETKKLAARQLRAELREYEALKGDLQREHNAVGYWVSGFKKLRLYVIEETLKTFEIEANSSLAALGLPDWRIELDVERENKSGGVTKGFTVLVHAPKASGPVKWESWSGGETQRLQLAGDLGLANLIMTQAGLESKVEFFDEQSKHLSQAGVYDLAEVLQQRALSMGKWIFLVDHHTIEFGGFAGVYKVTKDETGSEISHV
jgi:Herelleviridae exonuclease